MRKIIILVLLVLGLGGVAYASRNGSIKSLTNLPHEVDEQKFIENAIDRDSHPLQVEIMREKSYPGSEFVVEETLAPGSNYDRYIVSYESEGNTIYSLLTIPQGEKPEGGFPVIIFNHGFIPPAEYRTTERYIAYTDAFSRNGYVLLRSDYRGHGSSEGQASGGYGSPDYTVDVLNGVSSIKRLKDPETGDANVVNPTKIGMWGHSMGGSITLRSMVVTKDVKAGVIWAGVVPHYADLINNWRRGSGPTNTPNPSITGSRRWRQTLVEMYGEPKIGDPFWDSISPISFVAEISGPVQIHHGTADASVPHEFSESLDSALKKVGKTTELYIYPGDDHDITANFGVAMERSVEFFNTHLK